MKQYLTYDDVQIKPKYSDIEHRSECNTITRVTKNVWLDIPLDPEWTNESYHPLALSVDRIKCGEDYTKDNIVICSRMSNVGRSKYDENKFKEVISYIKAKL